MTNPLFTAHHRENRPLSGLLENWARTARSLAQSVARSKLESATDSEVVEDVLGDWKRVAMPLARQRDPAHVGEPRPAQRAESSGTGHRAYWRWLYRFVLDGNVELLSHWPELFELEPGGASLDLEPVPDAVWDYASSVRGVCATIDVSEDDDPEGLIAPRERLLDATRFLDRVIELANAELAEYEKKLTDELLQIVRLRRKRLQAIAASNREAIDLVAKAAPVLAVSVPSESDESVKPRAPVQVEVDGHLVNLDVTVTRSTFAELVDVCSRWADGVQNYPGAYWRLGEDAITSLLVTTLNIVFDTARREVFMGNGKTDIFVESARGDRSRAAYIGETKVWHGPGPVPSHFSQLLSYASERVREVLLVYYVKNVEIDDVRKKCRQSIEEMKIPARWVDEDKSKVTVEHPQFGHEITVAVMFVHLPPPQSSQERDSPETKAVG